MPGVYKEKVCPTCGTKHRKKGQYCSKTCSNKGRDDTYRAKMRDKMLNTDEGQVRAWQLNWDEDTDAPIAPQVFKEKPSLQRGQFVSGGDIWTIADD